MAPKKAAEKPKYPLTLVVHTTSREEFKLDLGLADEDGVVALRNNIEMVVFSTIKHTKGWVISDARGVDNIFNTDHIIAIELRLARN